MPWQSSHYRIAAAIKAGNYENARTILSQAEPPSHATPPDISSAIDAFLSAAVKMRIGNEHWADSLKASLPQHASALKADGFGKECLAASYVLCGIASDDRHSARCYFDAALEIYPDFLPALIERALVSTNTSRVQCVSSALGLLPRELEWQYRIAASELSVPMPTDPTNDAAICIRGLCGPSLSAIARYYKHFFPNACLIVGTWEDSDGGHLKEIDAICDVLDLAPPIFGGREQNINRQIILANRVLRIAAQRSKKFALLARSDFVFFSRRLLIEMIKLLNLYPPYGSALSKRIVIPDIYTRKYHLYHPSDLFMFGCTKDLLLYWDVDLSPPTATMPPEIRLARNFCEKFGIFDDLGAFRSALDLLRSFFIVRDLDWLEGLWLRYPDLVNSSQLPLREACMSQREWERLVLCEKDDLADLGWLDGYGLLLESALGLRKI